MLWKMDMTPESETKTYRHFEKLLQQVASKITVYIHGYTSNILMLIDILLPYVSKKLR